jgi:hypothetical protein
MRSKVCVECDGEKAFTYNLRCVSCANRIRNLGRIRSDEACEAISKAKIGKASPHKGKTYSIEIRNNMSVGHGGDGDMEKRRYGAISTWTESVKKTFTCCVICQSVDRLEAHHIAPKARYPELSAFALNGVTLCYDCHRGTNGVHKKREV